MKKQFLKVANQTGIKWNITMGLYWIRPYFYLNLDSKNRSYLKDNGILSTIKKINSSLSIAKLPNGKDYLLINNLVKKEIENIVHKYNNLPEFSYAAWQSTEGSLDLDKEKEPDITLDERQSSDGVKSAAIDFDKQLDIGHLVFENKIQIERQIQNALRQGKNIIFTGPPGTGKSKLAIETAKFYGADYKMITASSHWSTYETLGGYFPDRDNHLEFKPGLFLTCVKEKETKDNINRWLIIDELNRADIDKAFGSFFSVVTGDEVELPFEVDNNHAVRLYPEKEGVETPVQEHVYVYPKDWRLIGTINTADKSSLFELSYAFMRRFAFINIGVPINITKELIQKYLKVWDQREYLYSEALAQIWDTVNKYRKIGPAILLDIVDYTTKESNFTDAILLYVMPQLEGLPRDEIKQFIESLKTNVELDINSDILKEFTDDFFGDML